MALQAAGQIWRGTVQRVMPDQRVWCKVPQLLGSESVGPIPVHGIAFEGAPVLVVLLSGSRNDMVAISDASALTEAVSKLQAHARVISLVDNQHLDSAVPPAGESRKYEQRLNAYASTALGYPEARAGLLEATSSTTLGMVWHRYTTYSASNNAYTRSRYNGIWSSWKLSSGT